MEYSDHEVIEIIRKGDSDAYKIIVDRYSEAILNLCYRFLNSQEEAEDVTQDVFLKAYQALERWEPKAQLKTWLYRIAINLCLNRLRRRKKIGFQYFLNQPADSNQMIPMDPASPDDDAEVQIITSQKQEIIRQAVEALPENQRQVIILYHYQNLAYKEIAEILNVSVNTVESRLFRAKKNLAKKLRKVIKGI